MDDDDREDLSSGGDKYRSEDWCEENKETGGQVWEESECGGDSGEFVSYDQPVPKPKR